MLKSLQNNRDQVGCDAISVGSSIAIAQLSTSLLSMLLGKGSVWAFLSVATTLAVAAATSFRSTASASLTVKHLLKKVAADTNLNFGQHIHDEREGVQQLYLSLLRSVHAHRALPYHSGDVWGGSRGQLDRHAIDKFLRKTSRHVPDNVRYAESIPARQHLCRVTTSAKNVPTKYFWIGNKIRIFNIMAMKPSLRTA